MDEQKIIDMKGKRIGRLEVLELSNKKTPSGEVYWTCLCDCGNKRDIRGTSLRKNLTLSCGCLQKETASINSKTHGYTIKNSNENYKKRAYGIWGNMKSRCSSKTNDRYNDYGGRGIKVCEEWLMFENFYKDMGEPPTTKHQIDRIDNDGNYCKENCRWATRSENMQKRRKDFTTSSKYFGVTYDKLTNRWACVINKENKSYWLGRFDTEKEAGIAYDKKAIELYGEYANTNKLLEV